MILCLLLAAATNVASATPTPTARFHLDVDRHVESLLKTTELPRFTTEVEVVGHTPQEMLERHLKGFDPICGASGGGAPSVADMATVRPYGLPLLRGPELLSLWGLRHKLQDDRYFVYRIVRPDGAHYYVREGRMPASQLIMPDAIAEPVAAFSDRKAATHAIWRFEHGFKTAEAPPPPPCQR